MRVVDCIHHITKKYYNLLYFSQHIKQQYLRQ